MTPFAPNTTSSTSGVSGSMVTTTVARSATCAGASAASPPAADSSSTGPRLRLWATTGYPGGQNVPGHRTPHGPEPDEPHGLLHARALRIDWAKSRTTSSVFLVIMLWPRLPSFPRILTSAVSSRLVVPSALSSPTVSSAEA